MLATMCAVAWAAHALIAGLPWEIAFVLGAIVSPTDPLAATIMGCLDARGAWSAASRARSSSTARPRS
jgi:hypothetical protein